MKKCTKFLVLALAVIALTAVFSIPSSAEAKGPVLYVSSNGTGDGLTPENPMGNGEGYDRTNGKTANKNVLVRALYEFTLTGGTIVLVEPVVIDTNDSYPTETDKTPAELNVPDIRGSVAARDYGELPVITVTSNYGGVDYRKPENGGAKLVLDHTLSPSSNLRLVNSGIWKDLIIEY
ncbi:MAG: hypothetical protein IKL40_01325, partial [Clostridia bacterium]|nr:hypothetical protein [Clostridia bacterium]